ncbi:sulfonate ABC transporter substrate-binding protein [Alicyclobacillus mali]|uniref:Sulfonate ABC transporter substrate-binding protein n=1 Tax=Alicyclobacillus mali (ex Roth et al. 2021) TaxID=1123961 RepID=A0ABS0F212_9BACL|nr:sulfonate ABC transporter substrate-binding protein [Alicyclobacillus mali (ex Roth et al. 2021)]MBF8377328.1 sulfonate ABC transporter substrate-binding protein [Alicyclobacillus mali (ex Roth et al. 2021)]
MKRRDAFLISIFAVVLAGAGISAGFGHARNHAGATAHTQATSLGEGVSKGAASTANRGVVRTGYQLDGTDIILKAKKWLDEDLQKKGYRVQWIQFVGGPQLLQAMNAGAIDFGETGDAPPIFAQAAGTPLLYLAHEPADPKGEAILVPPNSPIHTVKDLKGKTIALNKGSNVEYMLVQQLKKAGLTIHDVTLDFLTPPNARAAFEGGKVDAWAIWDPYEASAENTMHARAIADGTGVTNNYQFYYVTRSFAQQHPDIVQDYLSGLEQADEWVNQHKLDTAKLLAPQMDIDVTSLYQSFAKHRFGIEPITKDIVAEQQSIANEFYQLGLIPNPIRVQDDVWQGTFHLHKLP